MKKFFLHHIKALKCLIYINKIDKAVIPLIVLNSVISSVNPYIDLFFTSFILNEIIIRNYNRVIILVLIYMAVKFFSDFFKDLIGGFTVSRGYITSKKIQYEINKKAMEMEYDLSELTEIRKKLEDAQYSVTHGGSHNVFILLYNSLAEKGMKIVISSAMILTLAYSRPVTHIPSVFNILNDSRVLLIVILCITLFSAFSSYRIESGYKSDQEELFKEKMGIERNFVYYRENIFFNFPAGKEIRMYNMVDLVLSKYKSSLEKSISFIRTKIFSRDLKYRLYSLIITAVYTVFIYFLVIFKAYSKSIQIGDIVKYAGAITILNSSITDIISTNSMIKLVTEYIDIFNEFINLKEGTKIRDSKRIPDIRDLELEFHDVSFRYPDSDIFVLEKFSYKFDWNKKYALVGMNGSGKSTLIKLMCGLYSPSAGYITLNGINIEDFKSEEYASLFSVVFQDFSVFAFSVLSNIAVSSEGNVIKAKEALERSGGKLSNNISRLDTILFKYDEKGINPSGGELQKIAISRAVYKNAPIFIMDEPTASLDPISETDFFNNVLENTKDKITVFISHRMSACKYSDEVIVLDKGKLSAYGSHEELIKYDNIYSRLFKTQANEFKTE